MSKRLVAKLAVMAATLGAVTLLQGCGDDEGRVFLYSPYMPCIPGVTWGTAGAVITSGGPAGVSQDSSGSGSSSTAGASALAHGGGGSAQVSGGAGL